MFNENDSNFSAEVTNNLETSLQNVYSNLNVASNSENFLPTIAPIFGESENSGELQTLVDSWTLNDFSQLPPIEILPSNFMNGADAAFSEETSTIYVSSEYFAQDFSNPDVVTGATGFLLEEVGHFVDDLINPGDDTPGDEGELFSATLMQLPLSSTDKQLINLEEDSGFVTIDNQEIAFEQSRKLPKITVRATETSAEETIPGQTTDFGKFTLRRTGDTTKALTVSYTLGGTATNGTDYKRLDRKVTFAAGSATASIDVKPVDDNLLEASETVTLTLATKRSYTIGTAKTATVNVANINPSELADFLWDKGDRVEQIGVELKNRGFDLPTIAYALNDGITKTNGSSLDYSEVAQGIWNSGYQGDQLNGGILADLLWDEGATQAEIAPALKNLGFSLPQIFVSLKGVTKEDGTGLSNKDISFGIWNSEYGNTEVEPGIIADLLWDSGVSQAEIGQTLKDAGFDLREIADAVDDKVTIDEEGNTLGYLDTAIALWNSGYSGDDLNSRVLADLLWDEGANEIEVSQSLKGIGLSLPVIADALRFGVTKADESSLSFSSVAVGIWNSGYTGEDGLNSPLLIDLLANLVPDPTAPGEEFVTEVAQTLYYQLGFSAAGIVGSVFNSQLNINGDNPTGNRFLLASLFLSNSGLALNTKEVADLFWDSGANQKEIAQILYNVFDRSLTEVAYDMKTGITKSDGSGLNLADIALGLSGAEFSVNGNSPVSGSQIVSTLLKIGTPVRDIGRALVGIGYDPFDISSSILKTVVSYDNKGNALRLNYGNVADALWWRGSGIDDTRELAGFLWDTGATQQQIGQALNYIGLSPGVIADALNDGVVINSEQTFNYTDTAIGLWNSGIQFKSGAELAELLWNEGANSSEIGEALRRTDSKVFSLEVIANSLDKGTGFSYTDIAKGLLNSGYIIYTPKLADILWDEGANIQEIATALYEGINISSDNVVGSLKGITKSDGQKLNYLTIAKGAWAITAGVNESAEFGYALKSNGFTDEQIGRSLAEVSGFDLNKLALQFYVIFDDPSRIAKALWNSGLSVSSRNIASSLKNLGFDNSSVVISQALVNTYNLTKSTYSLDLIADALNSTGYSVGDIAKGLDNSGLNPRLTDIGLAIMRQGYSRYRSAVGLVDAGLETNYFGRDAAIREAEFYIIGREIGDVFDAVTEKVTDKLAKVEPLFQENKGFLKVIAPQVVEMIDIGKAVATSIKEGNIDGLIDIVENKLAPIKELVKNPENFLDVIDDVPVLGTAISFGQAAIAAFQGNEKEIFKEVVQAGLAFYGFGKYATITDILIDVGWGIKDKSYQDATKGLLEKFIDSKTAEVFTNTAWAMAQGSWKDAINAALNASGFENVDKFSAITWSAIEGNYESAIKEGLSFVGYNPSQADSLMKAAISFRDSDYNKLVSALTGKNVQDLINQKTWVKNLTDGNTANDLQAIQDGLKETGFTKAKELSDVFLAVKNKNLVQAASITLSSTGLKGSEDLKQAQQWAEIIVDIKDENYLDALTTAFKLAEFKDGEALAKAAISIKNNEYLDAFFEGISLIDGADELKDGFKDLSQGDVDDFIKSIVASQPLLEKILEKVL
jgi:trimeric autotransporter adhesin